MWISVLEPGRLTPLSPPWSIATGDKRAEGGLWRNATRGTPYLSAWTLVRSLTRASANRKLIDYFDRKPLSALYEGSLQYSLQLMWLQPSRLQAGPHWKQSAVVFQRNQAVELNINNLWSAYHPIFKVIFLCSFLTPNLTCFSVALSYLFEFMGCQ